MKKSIITLVFSFLCTSLFAQDYYWVGGSGNWSDYESHWATASGGSTFHTQAPTSEDNVIFDANSFSAFAQVVTLDVDANCLSMNWTGVTNFPVLDGNSKDLNVYASLTLSADMTADFNDLEFESNTTGNTITTNGTDLGATSNVRFNGIGGEWTLQDNLTCRNLYITAGTLNTNNNDMDTGVRFQTSGSLAKTVNLGSSEITASRWWMTGTNLTINAGTSKIITSSFYSDQAGDGPYDYYDVEFFTEYGTLRYSSTFHTITIPGGIDLNLGSGDTFTVDDIITLSDKFNPSTINALTESSAANIVSESSSIDISFVEIQDIHVSGGADFNATNSIDNGNNVGWNTITAPVPQDYYWVGDGGDWSDYANHWATTTGGSTFHTGIPSRYDNVFFDANSFSQTGETVNLDTDVDCRDMDWTGVTNAPRIYGAFGIRLNIFGSATFTNEVDKDVYTAEFEGGGTHSITFGGTGDFVVMRLNGSGTYNFQDSVHVGLDIQFQAGTSNLNGNPISAGRSFEVIDGTINAGNSNIYCDDFDFLNSSNNPTFNAGTSTITVKDAINVNSTTERSFSFYNLKLNGSISVEGEHTIENLTISKGSSISFEEETTTTINGTLTMEGDKADPISISSIVGGTQATLSKASGTVDATYLILQDMVATGGAIFNATETIDNGNNTGWNITGLTPDDYYWVGGSGNWSDFENHWATESGGSTFHVAVPGVLDDVYFDANSFDADSEVVTIDGSAVNCNDFDASTADQFFTISGSTKVINIYGSLDLSANSNLDFDAFNFLSTGSAIIDFAGGPGGNWDANFLSNGTWTFESDVLINQIDMENGTINTGDFNFDVGSFDFIGDDPKVVNLGSSSIVVNSFRSDQATNVTFNGENSSIAIRGTYLLGNDPSETITLNDVTVSQSPLIYTDMSVNQFTIEPGTTLKPVSIVTITTNDLIATGTEGSPIIIEPQTEASTLTFVQSTGTVNGDYLELEAVTATGGAIFNAFNSIDNGDVVGWIFSRLPQTITFDPLEDKTFGDAPILLEATASSSLDVTFQLISGPASLDGSELTLTGAGTVQVRAVQLGNIDYDPAPSQIRSFEVLKAAQSITFEALADKTFGDEAFSLTATGGASGNSVTYVSSNLDVATVTGAEVTIVGAGTTTITASQAGTDDYNAAADTDQDLVINKANQSITFDDLSTKTFGDEAFSLTATGGASGNTVTYVSSNLDVATVTGAEVTIVGVGTTTITASQAGNDNYNAATDVDQQLVIGKADQSITFNEIADYEIGLDTDPIMLDATASSELTVSYSVSGPATLSGTTLTPNAAGTVTVTASQAGNDNYNAAPDEVVSFTVTESQTLGLTNVSLKLYPNPTTERLEVKGAGQLQGGTLAIHSLRGELIRTYSELSGAKDISDLKAGIYLVSLSSNNRRIHTAKLVVR